MADVDFCEECDGSTAFDRLRHRARREELAEV
jgi:hypothetical protein